MASQLTIKANGELLRLPPGASIRLVLQSPVFGEDAIPGDYSFPFTLPFSPKNRQIMLFPEVPENTNAPLSVDADLFYDGILITSGKLNRLKSSENQYQVSLSAKASEFGSLIFKKKLAELPLGGVRTVSTLDITEAVPNTIVDHMKAAAQGNIATYDYTFFPVLNEDFYKDLSQTYFKKYINWYTQNPESLSDRVFFVDTQQLPTLQPPPPSENTIVPFPYVVYLLKQIFTEHGYRGKGSFLDDDEIKTLVQYNTFALDDALFSTGFHNYYKREINLQNHVPDVLITDWLVGLKNIFCLGFFFNNQEKTCEIIPLKEVINSTDYIDWSDKAVRVYNYEDVSAEGVQLKHEHDSADDLTDTRINPIEKNTVKTAVDTFADLPSSGNSSNDIRLVKSLNQYYIWNAGLAAWKYFSENFFNYKIGEGKKEISSIFSPAGFIYKGEDTYATYFNGLYPSDPLFPLRDWMVPQAKQKGNSPMFDLYVNNPYTPRLLFYRGFRNDGNGEPYPLGSYHNYDYDENRIGNYSLSWDGDDGLYNVWWKDYLNVISGSRTITIPVRLNLNDLLNLDFKKKIRIRDVNYLIKSIDIKLPITEPASVELIRI